jgi:transposase
MVLDGPMNGAAFRAFVEQVLVRTLKPGDIAIMPPCPPQRRRRSRAIEAAGATRLFLPPYSPKLNPAETIK